MQDYSWPLFFYRQFKASIYFSNLGLYGDRAKILSLSDWYSPTELKSPVERTETNRQLATIIIMMIPKVLNFNIYLDVQGISKLGYFSIDARESKFPTNSSKNDDSFIIGTIGTFSIN